MTEARGGGGGPAGGLDQEACVVLMLQGVDVAGCASLCVCVCLHRALGERAAAETPAVAPLLCLLISSGPDECEHN